MSTLILRLFALSIAASAAYSQAALAIEPALDSRNYPGAAWSPYLVGAGIGVLSWLTFYFYDKPIGASSFYATVAGMIGKAVAPKHTNELDYFKDNPPKLNWEFVFVLAAVAGAAVAAWSGGEVFNEWVPEMWRARFGDSLALRGAFAFGGGVLMAFGARLAGGCTSGHGISGTLQLNVASWIAVICFFVGGAIVANLMFRI
ncbi:MAG: YeeE/YedE thiosulfate transporter family protein [Beijerinckiaceae bacterium]|nr:YeeE/YedE thiosulfate transporter family protein [Beijerinckiaceae bacterium]